MTRTLAERVTRLETMVGETFEGLGEAVQRLTAMVEDAQAGTLQTQKNLIALQELFAKVFETLNTRQVQIIDEDGVSVAVLGVGVNGAGRLVLWDAKRGRSVAYTPASDSPTEE